MRISRKGHIVVGVAVIICMLAGCSGTGAGVAQEVWPGVPTGLVTDPLDDGPSATWIERGETFAIVTYGSGSCPAVATAVTADGPDRVAVTFGPSPNDPCTADISPTTHELLLPDEVTSHPVTIEITYEDWPESHMIELD